MIGVSRNWLNNLASRMSRFVNLRAEHISRGARRFGSFDRRSKTPALSLSTKTAKGLACGCESPARPDRKGSDRLQSPVDQAALSRRTESAWPMLALARMHITSARICGWELWSPGAGLAGIANPAACPTERLTITDDRVSSARRIKAAIEFSLSSPDPL